MRATTATPIIDPPGERLQEERLQEERLQEERLQDGRLQEERLQEGRLQDGRLQDGRPPDVVVFDADETIPLDRADRAIVAALAARGLVASRASVQRWIGEGRALVDGRPCTASSPLRTGARVQVRPGLAPPSSVIPDPNVRLDVVFEDESLLVVDKPPGMVVHPAKGHWEGTLVHGLTARPGFDARAAWGDGEAAAARPGIVHRLDKGTSGLLVVAKDPVTREGLKVQFSAHTIDREYVAVVVGRATDRTIDAPHGRHPRDRMRFTSLGTPAGAKRAVTHVWVVEDLNGATLVGCKLETGRTHQIRVHLSERMGTPVLADPVYGKPTKVPLLASVAAQLGRQALHARLLGFRHPRTGDRLVFESELPEDMQGAVSRLRS